MLQALRYAVLSLILLSLLGGCQAAPQQRSFATPEEAVEVLVAALRADDGPTLRSIFGADAEEILDSGDEAADAAGRAEFLALVDERWRLVATEASADVMTLEVGRTEWPLPIPLARDAEGWFFDTDAGLDELLSRRIGRNELSTIRTCLAIVDAQREFASRDAMGTGMREYAQRFRSDPGTRNGLYWTTGANEPPSPLGPLVAEATVEGYFDAQSRERQPFHGYYYRILTRQGPSAPGGAFDFVLRGHMIGGFGVVAWPADYGNSGIKTFITSHLGIVYERDLGDGTTRIAERMSAFDPDEGWTAIATVND